MSGTRLALLLWWRRGGWVALAGAALLVVAAVLEWRLRPALAAATAAATAERARSLERTLRPGAAAPATAPGNAARRDADFRAALAREGDWPRLLRAVFAEARRHGLEVASADYRASDERDGRYRVQRMILPVSAPYPQVRAFIDAVLRAHPGAALEEMSFRRERVAQAHTEARLSFVFFLRPGESP